jgi:LPS-assembly lipoprotein
MWSSERRRLLTLLGAGALAGCGFELRRPPALAFRSIALAGFAPRSALADDFRRSLARGVQVKEREADAEVVLQALADERSQSVVASTSAAQVRELRLTLKFRFRAHTPAGELFRAMQTDVVAQVLRRLAAIRI